VQKLGLPRNPKTPEHIFDDISKYLAMPQAEKKKVPVKDDGGPENE